MSEQAAADFMSKLKADPALRKELSGHIGAGALDSALEFASKNGHSFSKDDLLAAYASDLKARGYSDADIDDLKSSEGNPGKYGAHHPTYAANMAPY